MMYITLKGLGESTKYLPCDAPFKSDVLLEPSARAAEIPVSTVPSVRYTHNIKAGCGD